MGWRNPVKTGGTTNKKLAARLSLLSNQPEAEGLRLFRGGGGVGRGSRVVLSPCLTKSWPPVAVDSSHVTDRSDKDFYNKIYGEEIRLVYAAAAGDQTGDAKVISLCKLFGLVKTPLQDRVTADYTVKKGFGVFPSPAGMSLTKLFLDANMFPLLSPKLSLSQAGILTESF
jgi:hypothetical protein